MFCVNCGRELFTTETICPHCGQLFPKLKDLEKNECLLGGTEEQSESSADENADVPLNAVLELRENDKGKMNEDFCLCYSITTKKTDVFTVAGIVALVLGGLLLFLVAVIGVLCIIAGIVLFVISRMSKRKAALDFFKAFDDILAIWENAFGESVCSNFKHGLDQRFYCFGSFTKPSRKKLFDAKRGPIGSVFEGVELYFGQNVLSGYRFYIDITRHSSIRTAVFVYGLSEIILSEKKIDNNEHILEFKSNNKSVTVTAWATDERIEELKRSIKCGGGMVDAD